MVGTASDRALTTWWRVNQTPEAGAVVMVICLLECRNRASLTAGTSVWLVQVDADSYDSVMANGVHLLIRSHTALEPGGRPDF